MANVYVGIRDGSLRDAILRLLARLDGNTSVEPVDLERVPNGATVITSSSDCTLARCAALAARGVRVIVLASLPSLPQKTAYLSVGSTAYLPMVLDSRELSEALADARRRSCNGHKGTQNGGTRAMKVLLALDDSPQAESAILAIADWARSSQAEVELFSVVRPSDVKETVAPTGFTHTLTPQGTASGQLLRGVTGPTPRTMEDRSQAIVRAHSERTDYLASLAGKHLQGVQTTVAIGDGDDVARTIVEEAERTGAAFIAMATRARTALGQALFGAIHQEVVRQATVPVLLVGPGARRLQAPVDVSQ
jgi:nucleotide-binding universal stress UspA family protein